MCYLAGGFLMVILFVLAVFSGYVSLLWFEIDCMGPGVGDFLHDLEDGLDDGLEDGRLVSLLTLRRAAF
jgi:hypothetical protein